MNIIEKAVDKLLGDTEKGSRATETQAGEPTTAEQAQPAVPTDSAASVQVEPLAAAEARAEPDTPVGESPVEPESVAASEETQPQLKVPTPEGPADNYISISSLGKQGILTPDSERSRSAEEYRMIKRPLLMQAAAGSGQAKAHQNLIMVTSSVEGEGKTFTSLNLAISIAMELDRTVLLVDADLAKPGLSRLLRVSDRAGLTDRLVDESLDLRDLMLRTDVPKLNILPAGRRHRRSTELLSSNNMNTLLDELATRYTDRVVLFDSPPILATSEASVLAQQMGQICLVVESTETPQYLVKEAVGQLASTESVSLILNKCKPNLFLGGYGYGYASRYSYGYGYGQGDS